MSKNNIKKLNRKKYFVNIDSSFKKGHLEIGEYFKKGKNKKRYFFQPIFAIHLWLMII